MLEWYQYLHFLKTVYISGLVHQQIWLKCCLVCTTLMYIKNHKCKNLEFVYWKLEKNNEQVKAKIMIKLLKRYAFTLNIQEKPMEPSNSPNPSKSSSSSSKLSPREESSSDHQILCLVAAPNPNSASFSPPLARSSSSSNLNRCWPFPALLSHLEPPLRPPFLDEKQHTVIDEVRLRSAVVVVRDWSIWVVVTMEGNPVFYQSQFFAPKILLFISTNFSNPMQISLKFYFFNSSFQRFYP